MTPEDLQKERNKRNAKKSRKKKKSYIETLEKKVSDLENALANANHELSLYKAKEHLYQTGDKSGFNELIRTEELLKVKGEEIVNKSTEFPDQFINYLSTK
jgi:hypothetical protein